MEKNLKKKLILSGIGLIVLAIAAVSLWWFLLRKVAVTFDYNNGKETAISVKVNNKINQDDIKTEDLSENFIGWFIVIEENDKEVVLDDKEFNFDEKVTKKTKLMAVYAPEEPITIKFDSKGGSKIEDLVWSKGIELQLPKNPTKDNYAFDGWKDKNGKAVKNGAILNEDITLYANWKKVPINKPEDTKPTTDSQVQTPTPEPTTNTTITNEVTNYKCEAGFKLLGTKCIKQSLPTRKCPEGTFSIGANQCVKISYADRVDSHKTCPAIMINYGNGHVESTEGRLVFAGTSFCYYAPINTVDENNEQTCKNRGHDWSNIDKKCYHEINQNYESSCDSGYTYISNPNEYEGIHGLNGGCYPVKLKSNVCPSGAKLTIDKRRIVCKIEKDAIKVN